MYADSISRSDCTSEQTDLRATKFTDESYFTDLADSIALRSDCADVSCSIHIINKQPSCKIGPYTIWEKRSSRSDYAFVQDDQELHC